MYIHATTLKASPVRWLKSRLTVWRYGLKDQYADYWEQNVNHTLINYKHCVANPNKYVGYGPNCWGAYGQR